MPTTEVESISDSPGSLPLARKAQRPACAALKQAFRCLAVVALSAASYFLITHFLVQSVKVVGRSMVPSLCDSELYLLNRWVYYLHAPRRCDIVVLRDPSDNGFSVKRIIATSGESVYLKDGNVYVNGSRLIESYLTRGTRTFPDSKRREQSFQCGKDQFFLLGDNRQNSIDSRIYGPIPRANILGPIVW
jgi:signal peptidase I